MLDKSEFSATECSKHTQKVPAFSTLQLVKYQRYSYFWSSVLLSIASYDILLKAGFQRFLVALGLSACDDDSCRVNKRAWRGAALRKPAEVCGDSQESDAASASNSVSLHQQTLLSQAITGRHRQLNIACENKGSTGPYLQGRGDFSAAFSISD